MDFDFNTISVVSRGSESPQETSSPEVVIASPAPAAETAPAPAPETTAPPATLEPAVLTETAPAPVETAPVAAPPVVVPAQPVVAEPLPATEYASPFVAKFNEYVAKGGDPSTFLQTQSANYDEMPEVELVRKGLSEKYPDASPAELEALFEDTYTLDEELYDERQIMLAKMRLRNDASGFRSAFKSEQAQYAIPAPVQAQQAQADQEAAQLQAWGAATAPVLTALSEVSIPYGEAGETLTYALTDKSALAPVAQNVANVFTRWQNADGSSNLNKMFNELAILDNLPAIIAKGIADGRSKGVETIVAKLENPSTPGEPNTTPAQADFWGKVVAGYDKHNANKRR